jgi:hypothetical protein
LSEAGASAGGCCSANADTEETNAVMLNRSHFRKRGI